VGVAADAYTSRVSDVAPQGPEVVLLSRLVGREVVAEDGTVWGRLVDLTVTLGPDHPTVSGVVVAADRGTVRLLPWRAAGVAGGVATGGISGSGPVRLARGTAPSTRPTAARDLALHARELLLARDVVDTQVVDLQDYRLSRVSDLYLVGDPHGALEVAAADVGLGAVLRRMGLGWLGRRLAPVVVDWQDLHLTSRRGHELQLGSSTAGFHRLDSQGLAELLTRLSTGHAAELIQTLPPQHVAAALHRTHPATGERLLRALGGEAATRVVAAAHPAHAARLSELHAQRSTAARRRWLRTAGWRRYRPSVGRPGQPGHPGNDGNDGNDAPRASGRDDR
jgi:hypothetical protein